MFTTLDISVNRLLKDEMRKKYVSFCMNQNKKEAKLTRDMSFDILLIYGITVQL